MRLYKNSGYVSNNGRYTKLMFILCLAKISQTLMKEARGRMLM